MPIDKGLNDISIEVESPNGIHTPAESAAAEQAADTMENHDLTELDERITRPDFFSFLDALDIDAALDNRDEEGFDECWMKASVLTAENERTTPRKDLHRINQIREKAFKLSYAATRYAELASCISDDFELIAKSLSLGKSDSWAINHLLNSYMKGIFPDKCG